jgi:hypothetical protein
MLTKLETLYTKFGCFVSSVNKKIESVKGYMPQYPKAINFEKSGRNLNIEPSQFFRKLFKFYPYFVADTVYFKIEVNYKKQSPSFELLYIDEYFNGKKESTEQIMFESSEYRGSTIGSEGKIEYIVRNGDSQNQISDIVFTAQVINKDRFLVQLIAAVLSGTIIAVITYFFAY